MIEDRYYGFVYITKNLINGKLYVGQKSFTPDWKKYLGSGTALKLAIKKYGKQNFKKTILCYAENEEELNQLEYFYIKLFSAETSENFYNILGGYSNCPEAHRKLQGIQRVCLNTKEIFNSATEAALKYNLDPSSIRECCNKDKCLYCGEINNKRLVWCNYSDFLKMSDSEIKNKLELAYTETRSKKVYCITLNKEFKSISDAASHFNLDESSLCATLRGKCKYSGVFRNQKLLWCYSEKWNSFTLKQQKIYINNRKTTRNFNGSNNPRAKKVKCLNYDLIFNTCKEAAKFAGLKTAYGISACAKGREKTAGKHPLTNEALTWSYI